MVAVCAFCEEWLDLTGLITPSQPQERQEKTGEAFMILSNGNKGTVNEGSSSKGKGRGK